MEILDSGRIPYERIPFAEAARRIRETLETSPTEDVIELCWGGVTCQVTRRDVTYVYPDETDEIPACVRAGMTEDGRMFRIPYTLPAQLEQALTDLKTAAGITAEDQSINYFLWKGLV